MGIDVATFRSELTRELNQKFSSPNDKGLSVRRKRLRDLFRQLDRSHSKEMATTLGRTRTSNELSRLFHYRLHRAVRAELIGILEKSPGGMSSPKPTSTPKPASEPPAIVFPHKPLPEASHDRFLEALDALESQLDQSNNASKSRYKCWFQKLRDGGDDRIVDWRRIYPKTAAPVLIVGMRDVSWGRLTVDQTELEDAVNKHGVAEAAKRVRFMVHLRTEILFNYEMTAESVQLRNLDNVNKHMTNAINRLSSWSTAALGGGSSMPHAYRKIKNWITAQQGKANSVYSCR